jgi:hypothetical protein
VKVYRLEQCLQASLILVERLKNEAQWINRMPRAILSKVFQLIRGDPVVDACEPLHLSRDPECGIRWIFITHVCKRWRVIAHDTPILWNRINVLDNPTVVQFFLDKSFPLSLGISFRKWPKDIVHPSTRDPRRALHALQLIRQNMDRVEDLHFFSTYPSGEVLQADNFSRFVVPNLSITRRPSEPHKSPSSNGGDLFSEFFSTLMPNLQKLSLHGSPVSSFLRSSVHPTALTHLALYEQPGWHENQTSHFTHLDQVLDLLQAISDTLQYLILVRAGPRSNLVVDGTRKKDPSQRQPVILSSLKSIEIGDWSAGGHIAHFLAHLNMPGSAKRCIWGPNLKYLSSTLFSIDTDTARTNLRGWDSDIKRVVLTCAPGGDMVGICRGTVYIQGGMDFQSIYPLFRDLPHVFTHVEELCLTPTPHQVLPSNDEYKLLFEALPNILRLSINDMDIGIILQALGVFRRRSDDAVHEMVLPELREVNIRYSTLNSSVDGHLKDALGVAYQNSILSSIIGLAKIAQIRTKDECPLERVSMHWGSRSISVEDNDDFADVISRLQRYVEHVDSELRDGSQNDEHGIGLVSRILEGMWPTIASKGFF